MNDSCATWIALSDREAIGEPLGADERAFLAQHGDRCSACAGERAVWQGLSGLVAPPRSAPALPYTPPPLATHRSRARWPAMLASAAAVGLIAVGGTWDTSRGGVASWWSGKPSTSASPPASTSTSTSTSVAGGVRAFVAEGEAGLEIDGKAVEAGETVGVGARVFARRGGGCLTVEPGVRACLAEGSLLRVDELSASQRRLSLLVGRLAASLDPQPAGTSFGVITRDGVAVAVGTAFSVEVPAGRGASVTRVMHGTVVVRGATGPEKRVTAHRMTAMDGEPEDLPPADEARELALVEAPRQGSGATSEPAAVGSTSADSSAPALANASEPTRGAIRLLLAAREARARGDVRAALAAYRVLFARHGGSPEAHAARVPYGEILLSEGAYPAALASFEGYLERAGSLAEEASFGRVRALRALGAEAAERAALVSFLQTYPSSPLCDSLRLRARALGAP